MHALRGWPAHRRLFVAVAMALVVMLGALVAVQSFAVSARAAVSLLCNQQTVYGVNSAKQLVSLDVSGETGTLTPTAVTTFGSAQNALGLSSDGGAAYAMTSGGSTIERYDTSATSPQPETLTTTAPVASGTTIIRGAVNPVNGIYYYAGGTVADTGTGVTTTSTPLFAYDPAKKSAIGQVATIQGLPANRNGDMAFSTSGQLFVVGGAIVTRVDAVPATAAGTVPVLTSKKVVDLQPNTVNSPGIAFTTDGFLYISSNTGTAQAPVGNITKLDPATGTMVWTRQITNYYATDLATCNYPDTFASQVSVDDRWHAGDQFAVALRSTAPDTTQTDANTTTGSAKGVQARRAGAVLTVPGRQYSFTETAAGTTSLADYTTTWTCTDVNDPAGRVIASGAGTSGAVTIPPTPASRTAGTEVTCTFVNLVRNVRSGAVDDTGSTPVNTALSVTAPGVLRNDTGTGVSAGNASAPAHGRVVLQADGSYVYTPDTDFSGADSFTYDATDSSGAVSTATVTVTVLPTAADDTLTGTAGGTAGGTATGNVLANDHGSFGQPVVTTAPARGTVTIAEDGTAVYTPRDAAASGTDTFTYRVTDSAGNQASATVTVLVRPTAADDEITATAGGSGSVALLGNDVGSGLRVTGHTDPSNGAVSIDANGVATYTAASGFSGTDSFSYTATDASGTTTTALVTVAVGVGAWDDADTTAANQTLTVAAPGVLGNDQGTDLTATKTTDPANGTATLRADGSWVFVPATDFSGQDSFTYTVTDASKGSSATATVRILVTPTAGDDTLTGTAGGTATGNVFTNDHGSVLTAVVSGQPANGTVVIGKDGAAVYTPNDATASGTDSFRYTVTDGTGSQATGTVRVVLQPKAVDDTIATAAGTPGSSALLGNDLGTGLHVTSHTDPTDGTVAVAADGTATYTPKGTASRSDSFTYTVTDAAGGTSTATVTVTLRVIANDDSGTTTTNHDLRVAAPGVLGNDSGSDLTATLRAEPTNGTVTLRSDGSYVYSPAADSSGTDSFTYTITDGTKGTTDTATVRITVTPTAGADTITDAAGGPVTGNVLGNDHGTELVATTATDPVNGTVTITPKGDVVYLPNDPTASGTDSFTYTVSDRDGGTATATVTVVVAPVATRDSISTTVGTVGSTNLLGNDVGTGLRVTANTDPAHGTVTIAVDGTATFTPDAGWSGTTSFRYTITDAAGTTASAKATVTVGVVGADDVATTPADTDLTIAAPGVLGNDQGTDLTASRATTPAHGSVALAADGSYTYSPAAGFSGTDSFSYTVTDADKGSSGTAKVTITVTPTAAADTLTGAAGGTVTGNVLDNDHGSGLSPVITQNPSQGTVTIDGRGGVVYTPSDPAASGTDSFQYTITDRSGGQSTGTVQVVVQPTAGDDTITTRAGTAGSVLLLRNDVGTGLVVTGHTDPARGTVVIASDGTATYTPNDPEASGTDTFTYTVTDASGRTATATVAVVTRVVATDDLGTTTTNHDLTAAAPGVLGNDHGSDLEATLAEKPTNGTVVLAADGSWVYSPARDSSGKDSFTYTVSDGSGGTTDTATVRITVTPTAGADTITGASGGTATGTVLDNDHGTSLRPVVTTQPTSGTVVLSGDGTVVYTPTDPKGSGRDSFTYTVTDPAGSTADATVSVVVEPVATRDVIQSLTDESGTTPLLANDRGTGLTITSHTDPGHGTLAIAADGTATFTPDAGWSGNTSFRYTVTDASGSTATANVAVTVGVIATSDTVSTPAGTTAVVDAARGVLANDRGHALTASLGRTAPQHGNVTLSGDGSYSYRPIAGFSGTDGFTYVATDDSGVRATGTVTIRVTPTAAAPEDTVTVTAGGSQDGTVAVSGSGLTTTVTADPGHGTVTVDDQGHFTYTPGPGYSGDDTFDVTTTDSSGQSTTVTVPVTVRPAAVADSYGTPAGTPLVVPVGTGLLANDRGSALSVTAHTEPTDGVLALEADGSFVYTPDRSASGTDSFTYTVTDGAGRASTSTVTIAVGVVATPDSATATAGSPLTVDADHGVLANDRGAALTVIGSSQPAHGTVTVGKDGSYVYSPADGWSGTDSFTYTVADSTGGTQVGTVTVTVLPRATDDTASTVAGRPLDVVAPGVLGNDRGSGITVTGIGTPAHGTVTIAPDGTLHYAPTTGTSGVDSFRYTITDGSGGTATATVTITVRPTAVPDAVTTPADTALVTTAATGVLANDVGTGLRVSDHAGPVHGSLVIAADGSYTYTPTAGFSGTDTSTYELTDVAGTTSTATVVIVVGPTATPDAITTATGVPVTADAAHGVLANDLGSGLTATIDLVPGHGTVQLGSDGSYTYTPTDGYSGTDVFTYTATDGAGTTSTGVVTVTITPKAVDDRYRTAANTPVTRSAAKGPLGNDHGRGLTVVAVGTPAHGTVSLRQDGAFVYTPGRGFSGVDSFGYTAEDATGARSAATITVTVMPVAVDDTYRVTGGKPLRITPDGGVLGDDTGSGLTVAIASAPAHGTVTLGPDGSFTYTPTAGYAGRDSFTYTTTDAAGNTATATVWLTVTTPAVATGDRAHGTPGKATTLQVLDNDTPGTGAHFDRGSVVLVDPTSGGIATTVTVRGQGDWAVQDGALVFTPASGFSGTASIEYRVTDSDGVTVTATATVDYPTAAAHVATVLAFTGGASLGWLALVALAVIGIGAVVRRRRGDDVPGPRRTGV